MAVKIGNGGLFVVFITQIPALQICFTGDVARATATAKASVRFRTLQSILAGVPKYKFGM